MTIDALGRTAAPGDTRTFVAPANAEDAGGADPEAAAAFHIGLLNRGIFIAPRGLMATSTVTEERDVSDAVDAACELFAALA